MKTAQDFRLDFERRNNPFYPNGWNWTSNNLDKMLDEYAEYLKVQGCDDLCHSLPTTPFESATCRKCGKLK